MTDYQVIAWLYALASICVVYKLAFLVRQTAQLPSIVAVAARVLFVAVGTVIVFRVAQVMAGDATAELFDVAVQIAWCAMLYTTIMVLGYRKHIW